MRWYLNLYVFCVAQCIYRNVIMRSSYIAHNRPFAPRGISHQYPSFLASELLHHNVIALVERSHTKIPACALAAITNIPLVHLHGNHPTLDRCAKAIQLSADFKDYAHASLDIINTFQWKNIAVVADGKQHRLYCFRICPFVSSFVGSFIRSFVCLFVRLFVCLWSCCPLVFWSCGRSFVWSFGRLVVSCGHFICLVFFSFLGVFFYSICFFLVFLESRFAEAVYFYGISQYSKFTLTLLQLTEKEGTNSRKASMQHLAENIANLDPEVILLYTTEEKIQLLMTQTVC